jgi:hypothetical protein
VPDNSDLGTSEFPDFARKAPAECDNRIPSKRNNWQNRRTEYGITDCNLKITEFKLFSVYDSCRKEKGGKTAFV